MGKIVMGYWDCRYCGSTKIKGTSKECPNCGRPKDSTVKHYMLDTVEYLDKGEAQQYGKGSDWHCESCDSMNSYKDTTCKRCGAPRSKSSKNYFQIHNIDSNEAAYIRNGNSNKVEKVTETVKLNVPKIEPEIEKSGWECEYCNTMNPKENASCSKCGAERDKPKSKKESVFSDDFFENKISSRKESSTTYTSKQTNNKKSIFDKIGIDKSSILAILGISAVVIAFIALLVFIFTPRERTIEVQQTTWKYTVNIEDYRTYVEDDWSIPSGGRKISQETRIRTYEQVLDHYETKTRTYTEQVLDHYDTDYYYSDNGDGTFTEHSTQTPVYRTETRTETYQEPVYRSEPVYDTYYTYEIERWKYARNVVTSGTDKEPYYGELNLASNERQQNTVENYTVTVYVKETEKTETFTVDYATWQRLDTGKTYVVKISAGRIIEIIE